MSDTTDACGEMEKSSTMVPSSCFSLQLILYTALEFPKCVKKKH